MSRLFAVLSLLAAAGLAVADVLPPDPQPGMKRVGVVATVEVAGDLPGYALYRVWWDYGPGGPPKRGPVRHPDGKNDIQKPVARADRVDFTPGSALPFNAGFYAVPVAAPTGFPTNTVLAEALAADKVAGAHRVPMTYPGDEIPIGDPRTVRTVRHVIERVDPEKGVICTATTDDPRPDDSLPKGGGRTAWIAGGFVGAAIVALTGLWLVRRSRTGRTG